LRLAARSGAIILIALQRVRTILYEFYYKLNLIVPNRVERIVVSNFAGLENLRGLSLPRTSLFNYGRCSQTL